MKLLSIRDVLSKLRYQNAAAPTDAESIFRLKFLQFFPDQKENINSYQENPGCRCVSKIVEAIQKDREITASALKSMFDGEDVSISFPRSITCEVRTIENTDEAYSELIQSTMRSSEGFRGLSVVPFGDKLKVFFY
jgi:hypothetical protein